ncbi:MAG: VIT1/CCC1 transporter family protein [Thermoplasmata archaeon]
MAGNPEIFYQNELNDADLYSRISGRIMRSFRRSERNERIARKLMELSSIESRHASFWAEIIKRKGGTLPPFRRKNPVYYKYIGFLQKLFGISFLVRYLERGEEEAIREYSEYLEKESKEQWERDQLSKILEDEREHEDTFIQMSEELKGSADKVRDAIYGMSDGLIEVLASVAGLTGVFLDHIYIAVGGIVFGASGLISMTIGSYLSEKAKGQIEENKSYSAGSAAGNTATYYSIGAIIPIIPFFLLPRYEALVTSLALVMVADGIVTSVISIQSNGKLRRDLARSLGLVTLGFLGTFAVGIVAHHFIGYLG